MSEIKIIMTITSEDKEQLDEFAGQIPIFEGMIKSAKEYYPNMDITLEVKTVD